MATLALWLGLVALGSAPAEKGAVERNADTPLVSMIQLLARPEEFRGRTVKLIGYAFFGFEESALYLHKDDHDAVNTANALWLTSGDDANPKASKLKSGWVIVEGVFEPDEKGHQGEFPGGLRIKRLSPWKPRR